MNFQQQFTPERMAQMRQHLDMLRNRFSMMGRRRGQGQMGSMFGMPDFRANMQSRMADMGGGRMPYIDRTMQFSGAQGVPFIDRTAGWQQGFPGAPAPYKGSVENIPFIDRTGGR